MLSKIICVFDDVLGYVCPCVSEALLQVAGAASFPSQPFTRISLSQTDRASAAHTIRWGINSNPVTLKSRLRVTQGHWKWYHLKAWVRCPMRLYGRIFRHFGHIQRQRMTWPWNLGLGSSKVIEDGAVRQTMYDFSLVRHCNYSSILYRLRIIWRWIISWPWNMA